MFETDDESSWQGGGQVPPNAGKGEIAGSKPKAGTGGDLGAKQQARGGATRAIVEKKKTASNVDTEGTAARGGLPSPISVSVDETTDVVGTTATMDDGESKERSSEENEDGPAEGGSKSRKRKKKKEMPTLTLDANPDNAGLCSGEQGAGQGTVGADADSEDPAAVSAADAPKAPTLAGADVGSSLTSIQEVPEPPPSPALTPTASPQVTAAEEPPSPMSLATSPRSESGELGMGGEGKEGGESKEGFFTAVGSAAAAATAAATSATAAATSLASAAKKTFRDKKKKEKSTEGQDEEKSKEADGDAYLTEATDDAVLDGRGSTEAGAADDARADGGIDIGGVDSADAAAIADPKEYVGAPPTRQHLRMKKRTSFSSEATDGTSSEGSRSSSSTTSSSSSSSSSSSEEEEEDEEDVVAAAAAAAAATMDAVDAVGNLNAATNADTDAVYTGLAGHMDSGDEATLTAANLAANEAQAVSTQSVAGAVASSDGSDGPSGTSVPADGGTGTNTANLSEATTANSTPSVSVDDVGDSLDISRSSLLSESNRNVSNSRTSSDDFASGATVGRFHSEPLNNVSPRDRERMMYNMSPAGE